MQVYPCNDNDDILLRLTPRQADIVRQAVKIAYQVSELGYIPNGLERLVRGECEEIKRLYTLLSEPEED